MDGFQRPIMSQKKDDAPLQLATLITMESHRSHILGLIGSLMLMVSGAKNSFVYIRSSRGPHCSASSAISYLVVMQFRMRNTAIQHVVDTVKVHTRAESTTLSNPGG